MNIKQLATVIVEKIVDDFTDRNGLRQSWEDIDEEIQNEIRSTWQKIIEKELTKWQKQK